MVDPYAPVLDRPTSITNWKNGHVVYMVRVESNSRNCIESSNSGLSRNYNLQFNLAPWVSLQVTRPASTHSRSEIMILLKVILFPPVSLESFDQCVVIYIYMNRKNGVVLMIIFIQKSFTLPPNRHLRLHRSSFQFSENRKTKMPRGWKKFDWTLVKLKNIKSDNQNEGQEKKSRYKMLPKFQ